MWYKTDGRCKSRIDRVLVNHNWMTKCPSSYQKGLRWTVSDHCPIILEVKVRDWGLKPFKCLNAWFSHPNFKEFVSNKWVNYIVDGWGSFIVKEKLKLLKADLKEWNKQVFGNLDEKIERHKQAIHELDLIDDVFGLEDNEIVKKKMKPQHCYLEV
ncbi:hypothetical protein ACS0TY_017812 [Phlomoides rotata]